MPATPDFDRPVAQPFGDRHRAMLEFERLVWKYPGARDAAIRDRFGWSSTRYYAELRWLFGQPEAMAYDPHVVNRLQRIAATKRRIRTEGAGPDTVPDKQGVRPRLL